MKKFFTKPKIVGFMVGVGSTLCTSVTAFAEETAPAIDWASAGTSITTQFNSALTALVPVGIVIFSTLLAIGFGPKIIKRK